MQVRLECTLEDLVGNWVELSEVWTRAELKRWNLAVLGFAPEESLFDLLQQELVAVHLYLPDGTLVTDAATLMERFDDLDSRLTRWLSAGISQAQRDMLSLAEARKRLLYDGVEIAALIPQTPRK